jgi:hypothetical protein
MGKQHISIWFFIGLLLSAYGILIIGAGIYEWAVPPERPVVLAEVHAGVWWGGLLLALGLTYTWLFRPSRERKHS